MKITPVKGRPMLHWVGKRPLDTVSAYPAQLVETYNVENPEKEPTYDKFKNGPNLLFHGDNKEILSTLLVQGFRGKIDLIYIDPPFASGADYVRKVKLRGEQKDLEAEGHSIIEQTQYADIWANDNYLQFMFERLILLRELLADNGSIYVHCDWRMNSYLRLVLDEIYEKNNFLNEIVWYYGGPSSVKTNFPRKHDTIFSFSKTPSYLFNQQRGELPSYLYERAKKDSDGRLWVDQNLGKLTNQRIKKMKDEGRIFETKTGGWRRKQYLDEMEGSQIDDVWEIPIINSQANALC